MKCTQKRTRREQAREIGGADVRLARHRVERPAGQFVGKLKVDPPDGVPDDAVLYYGRVGDCLEHEDALAVVVWRNLDGEEDIVPLSISRDFSSVRPTPEALIQLWCWTERDGTPSRHVEVMPLRQLTDAEKTWIQGLLIEEEIS